MKKYDVLVVGDVNVDLVVTGIKKMPLPGQERYVDDISLNVGGGAALSAIGLARLGMKSAVYGSIGDDFLGVYIVDILEKTGVDTSFIQKLSFSRTGISIALSWDNDRSFLTYVGSNGENDLNGISDEIISQVSHAHLAGYKADSNHDSYVELVRKLKKAGIPVSMDVGWDESEEWSSRLFELVKLVDVFSLNETEASHYCGTDDMEKCIRMLSEYCGEVIIKMGPRGAMGMKNGSIHYCSTFPVSIVDTTGAGDSFNSGFLYGRLTGCDFRTCLIYGNACGALSTTRAGGYSAFPDKKSLHDFIAGNMDAIVIR